MIISPLRPVLLVFVLIATPVVSSIDDVQKARLGNSSGSSHSMFTAATERAFELALKLAKDRSDAFLTAEHALIKITEEETAAELLNSNNVDLVALRSSLITHIDATVSKSNSDGENDPQPESQFRLIMQRAVMKLMATNKKRVDGADYILAVLAHDDTFAAQALREHGLTIEVAEDQNLELYFARTAKQNKKVEALRERINKLQLQDRRDFSIARGEVNVKVLKKVTYKHETQGGYDERDSSHKVYTLRIVSTVEDEAQFKCAISHDGQLDLYIEETPFEVDFVARKIVVLLDTINSNTRLDVSLVTEVEGEQTPVSGFSGSSGAIFHDPWSQKTDQQSGRF